MVWCGGWDLNPRTPKRRGPEHRVPRPNLTDTFLPGSNSGLIATDRLQLQLETRGTDFVVDGKYTTLY